MKNGAIVMRALIPILFALASAAYAGPMMSPPLGVNLDITPLVGYPGETLTFSGTLTDNTGSTLFINSDSLSFEINGAADDLPFKSNAPISIDAGDTSADFGMFEVNIPGGQAIGPYTGLFTVLGGTDGTQLNNLGSAQFEVDVMTPEPAYYLLVACALAFMMVRRSLRHS